MNFIKEHIVFKLLTVLLVITLLVPATVKLAHVFEHHEHEVCLGGNTTHIHKVDLDCEFQKFNLNNTLYLFSFQFDELTEIPSDSRTYNETYTFLNNHRSLSFSLRGPPILV